MPGDTAAGPGTSEWNLAAMDRDALRELRAAVERELENRRVEARLQREARRYRTSR